MSDDKQKLSPKKRTKTGEEKKFPFSGNSLSESVEIVYAILLPER